jgi:hypothetical protein
VKAENLQEQTKLTGKPTSTQQNQPMFAAQLNDESLAKRTFEVGRHRRSLSNGSNDSSKFKFNKNTKG